MNHALHVVTVLALAGPAWPGAEDPETDKVVFAAPVQLITPSGPISKKMYPSPAIFDIDGDGARELVLGDLAGYLWISEQVEGAGELTWTEPKRLENGEEPLQLNNW